jgi:hypothetical protein
MTAEVTHQEPSLVDKVAYTRQHLPPDWRSDYETWLREAAAKAAASGDVTALSNVIEQGWIAARFEHEGGEGYQRYKRLILEGRWKELMAQLHSVDVDAMLREQRP